MADSVRVTNFPNPGSHEAGVLEMWKLMRFDHSNEVATSDGYLKMYRRCLDATFNRPESSR